MSRVERLLNLTAALLNADRPLTREEISRRVPGYEGTTASARRTFERDKETLRDLGIPIATTFLDPSDPGSAQGYRIPRAEYELADPGLAPDELAALHLASATVRLPGTRGTEALWKLGGAPDEVGPLPAQAVLPGSGHLVALFDAVAHRRSATFDYRSEKRTVDPYRLAFRNGHWYLEGRDQNRDEIREFRIDRIGDAPIGLGPAGAFERPEDGRAGGAPAWLFGDGAPVTARLLVDGDQAGWAISHLGEDKISERREDGSVVFEIAVSNHPAFRSFVLGFLQHAEILSPPEIRADIIEWLEDICRP